MTKIPILLLIFNRPDLTKKVFDQIKKAKPTQLFIAADGPRVGREHEQELCAQARATVDLIDWDCEVKTLFRDTNLGCGLGVSSAINWFFDHVEEGIILEDDCIPDLSFFSFCQTMLEQYRHDDRVAMISGTNVLPNQSVRESSYSFARYYDIWGWATWKRAWQKYDYTMQGWPTDEAKKKLRTLDLPKSIIAFWEENFNKVTIQKIDTWDYQWTYACLLNNNLSIVPSVNLVSNEGLFGAHANGNKSKFHEMPTRAFDLGACILRDACFARSVLPDKKLEKKIHQELGAIKPFSCKELVKKVVRRIMQS